MAIRHYRWRRNNREKLVPDSRSSITNLFVLSDPPSLFRKLHFGSENWQQLEVSAAVMN